MTTRHRGRMMIALALLLRSALSAPAPLAARGAPINFTKFEDIFCLSSTSSATCARNLFTSSVAAPLLWSWEMSACETTTARWARVQRLAWIALRTVRRARHHSRSTAASHQHSRGCKRQLKPLYSSSEERERGRRAGSQTATVTENQRTPHHTTPYHNQQAVRCGKYVQRKRLSQGLPSPAEWQLYHHRPTSILTRSMQVLQACTLHRPPTQPFVRACVQKRRCTVKTTSEMEGKTPMQWIRHISWGGVCAAVVCLLV